MSDDARLKMETIVTLQQDATSIATEFYVLAAEIQQYLADPSSQKVTEKKGYLKLMNIIQS